MTAVEVILKCQLGQHAPGTRVRLTADELAQLPPGWYEPVEKPAYTEALRESARKVFEAIRKVRDLHHVLNPGLMSDPFREALNTIRVGAATHASIGTIALAWPPDYVGRSDVLDAVQAAVPEYAGPDGLIRPRTVNYYRQADDLLNDLQAWGADAGPIETFFKRLAVKASEAESILQAALERKRRRAG